MDGDTLTQDEIDRRMMRRCIDLSVASGNSGEYPYAAVICRNGQVVAESTNRARQDHDVTRHAELVAISLAQKSLRAVSLDDCEIYVNAEPCALCSYAIRESRIRRVVFGLSSPHMGGLSKWNVLSDNDICNVMPEAFAPPPEVLSGYMTDEVQKALMDWNPLVTSAIKRRGVFEARPAMTSTDVQSCAVQSPGMRRSVWRFLRRNLFDYFGRR